MVYLLIIFVPPTLAGGAYLCWRAGEKFAIKQLHTQTSKPKPIYQTFSSYAAGTTTLVGTYGLAEYLFTHRTKIPQKQEITSTINTKTPKIKEKEGSQVGRLKEKLIIR